MLPSAEAIGLAIRARREAGQHSRAASRSALALDLYPNDAATANIVHGVETIGFGGAWSSVEAKCSDGHPSGVS